MREDMYVQSGPASFSLDTTRERIPTGSTYRYQIGKLSVAEIREMLRNTTRMLIARARQNGELDRPVMSAVDTTKGFRFTGDIEGHEDDRIESRSICLFPIDRSNRVSMIASAPRLRFSGPGAATAGPPVSSAASKRRAAEGWPRSPRGGPRATRGAPAARPTPRLARRRCTPAPSWRTRTGRRPSSGRTPT